jgi:hypothetical protein
MANERETEYRLDELEANVQGMLEDMTDTLEERFKLHLEALEASLREDIDMLGSSLHVDIEDLWTRVVKGRRNS